MNLREQFEKREQNFLSPFGCQSARSRGRQRPEPPCALRTAFQVDRDRIVYSNAFRRLKHKTQVFLNPLGDEYRTRLTHTLEVSLIARTIARAMFLNEDLAEAIAMGHDLGHPPFGHGGEAILKEIHSPDFSHNRQSLRVVDVIENDGLGLNLTDEVRNGILKHSKGYGKIMPDDPEEMACTIEGRIVRIADIMAYLNHDLDDAVRSGVIREDQIPDVCVRVIGKTHQERATTMTRDLVFSSRVVDGGLQLAMSDTVSAAMTILREFLYENVYRSHQVHREFVKVKKILSELYAYFLENPSLLEVESKQMGISGCMEHGNLKQAVCDFIASMTDRHALHLYEKIFFPTPTI
ncbi:deoxyguanosinetriphosphate triphosphohydrolase [Desulfosarcina sp. OttesenSCG-928-A07]|nr:deoxyguanosinetriphosphate triphosphohydrolase [Desulfosarcina sp. OttesenSCG-928-G17]MDL2330267.1 deoxyguanosinetriphosphate triphosphohydrolase [Desulfosarcina sp. OttesenSCG-928-A07]